MNKAITFCRTAHCVSNFHYPLKIVSSALFVLFPTQVVQDTDKAGKTKLVAILQQTIAENLPAQLVQKRKWMF